MLRTLIYIWYHLSFSFVVVLLLPYIQKKTLVGSVVHARNPMRCFYSHFQKNFTLRVKESIIKRRTEKMELVILFHCFETVNKGCRYPKKQISCINWQPYISLMSIAIPQIYELHFYIQFYINIFLSLIHQYMDNLYI